MRARRRSQWLIATASFLVAAGVGAWLLRDTRFADATSAHVASGLGLVTGRLGLAPPVVTTGSSVCTRCGRKKQVSTQPDGRSRDVESGSPESEWAKARIGACVVHSWRRVRCWLRETLEGPVVTDSLVSCTMIPNTHVLYRALVELDDAPADELAKRYARLSLDRRSELWEVFARMDSTNARGVARRAALEAGWSDLAARWPE